MELARNPNLAKVYAATFIPCPGCNQPIRKVACNVGSFFVTCENYLETVSGPIAERRSKRCGQHMYIVALEGIAVVVPLSHPDFKRWLRTYPTALEVFSALGVTPSKTTPAAAGIPSFNCKKCGDRKELQELFGGECRRCAGLERREA